MPKIENFTPRYAALIALRTYLVRKSKQLDETDQNLRFVDDEAWEKICILFESRCVYCNSDTRPLTKDHLIPMNEQCGLHIYCNVVPACKRCNSKRRNSPWKDFLKKINADNRPQANRRIKQIQSHNKKYISINDRLNEVRETGADILKKTEILIKNSVNPR